MKENSGDEAGVVTGGQIMPRAFVGQVKAFGVMETDVERRFFYGCKIFLSEEEGSGSFIPLVIGSCPSGCQVLQTGAHTVIALSCHGKGQWVHGAGQRGPE